MRTMNLAESERKEKFTGYSKLNKIKILFNLGESKCRIFPNKLHADASAQIPIPPASKRTLLTQHQ